MYRDEQCLKSTTKLVVYYLNKGAPDKNSILFWYSVFSLSAKERIFTNFGERQKSRDF